MPSPLIPATVSEQTVSPVRATSILHRTPWRPPVAVSGEGIYITLEDGRKVIDGVGGAAVNCLGNGHPEPVKAIKEQVDKLSCELMPTVHRNQKMTNGCPRKMCIICSCLMNLPKNLPRSSSILVARILPDIIILSCAASLREVQKLWKE
jgi:Aminotransferase class-III